MPQPHQKSILILVNPQKRPQPLPDPELVQFFLVIMKELGIDIKAQDNDGKTALDLTNQWRRLAWGGQQILNCWKKKFSRLETYEATRRFLVPM